LYPFFFYAQDIFRFPFLSDLGIASAEKEFPVLVGVWDLIEKEKGNLVC
jgi:hypothetical protein